jgi:putative heme iron utilization protein
LFLISELSRHTRNLAVDARASLLLTSETARGDPLNQPRLTLGGKVVLHPDPTSRTRYLRRNPKAKLYADFGDFAVRRLEIETIHFNGGFGRADKLTLTNLLTPVEGVGELIASEEELLADVDASRIATLVAGGAPGRRVWRAVGLDAEGLDLASGRATARVDFLAPARGAVDWRQRWGERLAI